MTAEFRFSAPLKVRYNETDMQGHVNFGHYLFYFDAALVDYLEAIGYDYQTMLSEGADMLYVEAHCNYKSRAYWPEVLDIHARVGHLGNTSLRFEFEVRARDSAGDDVVAPSQSAPPAGEGRLVATGHIVIVMVEREGMTAARIPQRMRDAIEAFEGE